MPTYEYSCTACGHRLDAVQKFSDDPLTECPECGGALRKVYGAVGIVLKGSGFYKTDSRAAAAGSNGNGKSPDKDGKDSDSKDKTSTESAGKTSSDSAGKGSSESSKKESSTSPDAKPAASTAGSS